MEQPGAEDAGEEEDEQGGGRRLVDRPGRRGSTNAGISSTPPTPTAPMKKPTTTATAASSAGCHRPSLSPRRRPTSSLVSSTASFFISAVAERGVALHQAHQRRAVDRDHLARREAVRGGDAPRVAFDQRRPAEHVAAADDVAGRGVALAQAQREPHHAVGEHVEVVDRVADRVDARVLRERARAPERGDALELRLVRPEKKRACGEDAAAGAQTELFSAFQRSA